MSTVIENQIVQMGFDNKEFERNISASMKSLDEFKEEMEFKDSERNFKDLEKASESVDFDKLNKAIDGVGDHFTLVGRVFYKVTDEIANYFTSKITSAVNAVKSVTTDIIDPKLGYSKYDDYTHGVKQILSALSDDELSKLEQQYGSAIDGVESKLGELMLYTDETSYNFTDMVGTIGKFLGAGIGLDSAVKDMQGIANWAALSGQNALTASQAMYQMSQALGAGYVKYQDWAQMANLKNMGTTAAKDVFIEAAKELGYIQQEDIEQAKAATKAAGGVVENYRNWFFESEQLSKQQWFKTEVLEKGLQKFSAVSDEVIALSNEVDITVTDFLRAGKRIKKGTSSVEVEMDKLRDSGKYTNEELKQIKETMERVTSEEYKLGWNALLAAQEAVTFGEAIDATKDAVGTAWMMIFKDLIGNYEEASILWTDLANNLYDTFAQPLRDIEEDLYKWSHSTISIFDENGKEVVITMREYMWKGLSRVLGGATSIIGDFFSNIFRFASGTSVSDVFDKITYGLNHLGDALEWLDDFINHSYLLQSISNLFKAIARLAGVLIDGFKKIVRAFTGGQDSAKELDIGLSYLVDILVDLVNIIADAVEWLINSKGFNFALKLVNATVETATYWIMKLGQTTAGISHDLESFTKWLIKAFSGDIDWKAAGRGVQTVTEKLLSLFKIDTKKAGKNIDNFFGKVKNGAEAAEEFAADAWDTLYDIFTSAPNKVSGAFRVIGASFAALGNIILEALGDAFGFNPQPIINRVISLFETVSGAVSTWFDAFSGRMQQHFSNICFDIFDWLPARFSQMVDNFQAGTAPQKFEEVLGFIGDCIKKGIERIIEGVGALTGLDTKPLNDKVLGFIERVVDKLNSLKPGFELAWDKIVEIFWALVDIFSALVDAIFDIIGKVTGIEDFGLDNTLDLVFWILEKMVGLLVWVAQVLSKVIVEAAPSIIALASFIGKGLSEVWLAFKAFIGLDNSPKAAEALQHMQDIFWLIIKLWLMFEAYSFIKRLKGLMTTLSDLGDAFTGWRPDNLMFGISQLVKGVAYILIAIAILSRQDPTNLMMATMVLAVTLMVISQVLKHMLVILKDLAQALKNDGISEKEFNAATTGFTKVMKSLTKLITRLSLILVLLTWAADYFGTEAMTSAMMTLIMTMTVLFVGIKGIIKVSSQLSASDKQLKQVRKTITKLVSSLTVIAVAIGMVVKVLVKAEKDGVDTESVGKAVLMLAVSIGIIAAAMALIIYMVGRLDENQANNAAKVIMKVSLASILMGAAVYALAYALTHETDERMLASLGIAFSVLVAVAGLIAGAIALINKIMNKDVVSESATALQTLAKAAGNVALIAITTEFMVVACLTVIGVLAVLYFAIEKAEPVKLITALAATFLLFYGVAQFAKLLGAIHVEAAATQILAMSVMIIALSVSIFVFIGALKLLQETTIEMDSLGALAGIGIVVISLTALAGLASILVPGIIAILEFSAAMVLLAGGLALFTIVMMLLQNVVDVEEFMNLILVMGAIIGVIAAAGAVIGKIGDNAVKGLNAIANAFLKFAIAIAIVAAVLGLMTIIDKIVDQISGAMENLETKLPELVGQILYLLIILIQSLADALQAHADELGAALVDLLFALVSVAIGLLKELLGPFFEMIWEVGQTIKDFFMDIWYALCDAWESFKNFFVNIFEGIAGFFRNIWEWICEFFGYASPAKKFIDLGIGLLQGLWDGIVEAAKWVWEGIKGLFEGLWDLICSVFDAVTEFFSGIIEDVWQGIKDGVAKVRDWIKNKIETIWNVIKAPFAKAFSLGKDIVEGLWNGINSVVDWIVDKITGFCDKALGAIKKFFGISSPSKVMAEVGGYLMDGLGIGIDDGAGGVMDTIGTVVGDVLGGFSPLGDGIPINFTPAGTEDLDAMYNMSGISPNVDYSQIPAFNAAEFGLDNVYTVGALADYSAIGAATIPANIAPTIKDAQLEQISDVNTQNTEEIVNALNEVKDELGKQAEIISKFSIILDTGTLVGELRDPMDKALGNKSRLATGRGI